MHYVIRHGTPDEPRNYFWTGIVMHGDKAHAALYAERQYAEAVSHTVAPSIAGECFVQSAGEAGIVYAIRR